MQEDPNPITTSEAQNKNHIIQHPIKPHTAKDVRSSI
jgi:hypothetical protein